MTNIVLAVVMVCSWERFDDAGKIAANGHKFNPSSMTCATWRYPFGTKLHITDSHNHLACDVIVTDRPARQFQNRVDLSPAAFSKLNGLEMGVCEVTVTAQP